jgi:hypothetical protein
VFTPAEIRAAQRWAVALIAISFVGGVIVGLALRVAS